MWGDAFLNKMCQRWRDKTWIKLDDTVPYNFHHRYHYRRETLSCVAKYHFDRYLVAAAWGAANVHKASKRKKLYWRLHPEYKK